MSKTLVLSRTQLMEQTVALAVEHLPATQLLATTEPGAAPEGTR